MKFIKVGESFQYEVTKSDNKYLALIGTMVMKKTAKFSHYANDCLYYLTTTKIDV